MDSDDDKPIVVKTEQKPAKTMMYDSDDDKPIVVAKKQPASAPAVKSEPNAKKAKKEEVKKPEAKKEVKKEAKKEVKKEPKKEVKKEVKKEPKKDEEKKRKRSSQNNDSDNEPIMKKAKNDQEEESEEPWWVRNDDDSSDSLDILSKNSIKWTTLKHNGVMFPPLYIPHHVKIKYEGKEIELSEEAEEVATMYAAMANSDYLKKPMFRKNFWEDWKEILGKNSPVKSLDKCDFTPIVEYLAGLKAKRDAMTSEEKKAAKAERAKIEEPYLFAWVDGKKEAVGNFRIEPPGLFRGRGEHPKMGKLKKRIHPEDVTLNMSEDSKPPEAPFGGKWGKVDCIRTATWLAMYKDSVNDSYKYVFLAANSKFKGIADKEKFEKARRLKDVISTIRASYTKDLSSSDIEKQQLATCIWIIDNLALRVGNEKGEDEADTVGCCSLRFEHIELEEPNIVKFDFLGKDSIRYQNEVTVTDKIFANLQTFKKAAGQRLKGKASGDRVEGLLFDHVDPSKLNNFLHAFMPGLSAKVFRTYNASITLERQLLRINTEPRFTFSQVNEKILFYNQCNRDVAILCNHQKAVPKGHAEKIKQMADKKADIRDMTNFIAKIINCQKLNRKREEFWDEYVEERRKKWDERHPESAASTSTSTTSTDAKKDKKDKKEKEKEKEKEAKKEEEEKAEADKKGGKKGPAPPPSTFEEYIAQFEDQLDKLWDKSKEVLKQMHDKWKKKLSDCDIQIKQKEETSTVSLGTSKLNYLDPRITIAWCKREGVPLEKVFAKTLLKKFEWALGVKEDYRF